VQKIGIDYRRLASNQIKSKISKEIKPCSALEFLLLSTQAVGQGFLKALYGL